MAAQRGGRPRQSGGRDVVRLTFSAATMRRDYWVDVERGAIALQMHNADLEDKLLFQINEDDLRQVGGRGWLPYHTTIFIPGPKGGSTKELIVVDADWSANLRQRLGLEFPEPVPMIHAGKLIRFAHRKIWDRDACPRARLPKPGTSC